MFYILANNKLPNTMYSLNSPTLRKRLVENCARATVANTPPIQPRLRLTPVGADFGPSFPSSGEPCSPHGSLSDRIKSITSVDTTSGQWSSNDWPL